MEYVTPMVQYGKVNGISGVYCILDVLDVCFIRIYHECEGRAEKSVPRIAVWHHEACRDYIEDIYFF